MRKGIELAARGMRPRGGRQWGLPKGSSWEAGGIGVSGLLPCSAPLTGPPAPGAGLGHLFHNLMSWFPGLSLWNLRKSRFPRGQITPLNPEHPLPESHPQPLRPASAALPDLSHHPSGPRGRCGLHERLGSRARPMPGKPSSCCFSGHSPAFPGSPRLHAPLGFGLLACPESLTS